MARKLTATRVNEILDAASKRKGAKFIIELVPAPKPKLHFHFRLKGNNGEPIAPGETKPSKQGVKNIVARLIDGGLDAKYKDLSTQKSR